MQRNPRAHHSRPFLTVAIATVLVLFTTLTGTADALGTIADPQLSETGYIRTEPFANDSNTSVRDVEGMAYIGADNMFWISDDKEEALYAVDRSNGNLIDKIGKDEFFAAGATEPQFEDLEALAWNNNNAMFAFSGSCCPGEPTAFKIKRNGYRDFAIQSFKTLPAGSDYSAAAVNSSGQLWISDNNKVVTRYYYSSNSFGSSFTLPIPSGRIQGMGFSDDGDDLFVVTNEEQLFRVDWASKTLVDCYTFDLTSYGIEDARAVDLVSDSFHILEGGDNNRSVGDPRRHAIFEFDVVGGGNSCGGGGGGGGGNSVTATPSDDSFINSRRPNKNFGGYDELRIKDDYEYRSFLKFNVSGVGGSVASATLRLWVTNGGNDAGRWYTAANFDEDTLVWNNRPSTGGLLVDHDGVGGGQWLELDVTNAVSGNGTYQFAGVPESTDTVRFSSKEGANPPQLVVTWN